MEAIETPIVRAQGGTLSITHLGPEETLRIAREAAGKRDPRRRLLDTDLVVSLILNRSLRTRTGLASACASAGVPLLDLPTEGIYAPAVDRPSEPYREESMADIARVMELHASCFAIRAYGPSAAVAVGGGDAMLTSLATESSIPIINLETDTGHPIQALADLATITDVSQGRRLRIVIAWAFSPEPKPVAVPASLLMAVAAAGHEVVVVAPEEFRLPPAIVGRASGWTRDSGGSVVESTSLADAVTRADVLYMKSWLASGYDHQQHRDVAREYSGWIADDKLLAHANTPPRFMHCLPADRGYEVTDTVIDGPTSLVWKQVEKRRAVTRLVLDRALDAARQ